MILRAITILTLILISLSSGAQSSRPMLPYALKGSIDTQFYYINILSRNSDADFKLIRKTNLDILKKNALDTINRLKSELSSIKEASASSIETTSSLRDSVSTLTAELQAEQQKTDSINFLGIDFQKGSYHSLVWSIIIVLGVGFVGILLAFRKSKSDTVDHKKAVNEIQDELQAFKKKAMEKEQILKRQLLDEQLKRNS